MKALPLGVDDFQSLISGEEKGEHYYYVDKTLLIREVAATSGKVHLIPRPRRFGKSLNLDMIRQFVDVTADKSLFQGVNPPTTEVAGFPHYTKFMARSLRVNPELLFRMHAAKPFGPGLTLALYRSPCFGSCGIRSTVFCQLAIIRQ